jgi:hypothetical protein
MVSLSLLGYTGDCQKEKRKERKIKEIRKKKIPKPCPQKFQLKKENTKRQWPTSCKLLRSGLCSVTTISCQREPGLYRSDKLQNLYNVNPEHACHSKGVIISKRLRSQCNCPKNRTAQDSIRMISADRLSDSSGECLPSPCEALSSNPSTAKS